MKLSNTLGFLALAGAVIAAAPSAHATATSSSSVTMKFNATVQDKVESSTSDGYVNTTVKVTIVNKDLLAAFEDWWETTLPAGANFAVDEDYNIVIVNKDGDIIYNADDLDGFLNLTFSDSITSDGRYKEKDNGDYTDSFDDTYIAYLAFLSDNDRSASIDSNNDYAYFAGADVFSTSDSYDASKNDYKFSSTEKASLMGQGIIEDSDAALTGDLKIKTTYKNDNYEK